MSAPETPPAPPAEKKPRNRLGAASLVISAAGLIAIIAGNYDLLWSIGGLVAAVAGIVAGAQAYRSQEKRPRLWAIFGFIIAGITIVLALFGMLTGG